MADYPKTIAFQIIHRFNSARIWWYLQ